MRYLLIDIGLGVGFVAISVLAIGSLLLSISQREDFVARVSRAAWASILVIAIGEMLRVYLHL